MGTPRRRNLLTGTDRDRAREENDLAHVQTTGREDRIHAITDVEDRGLATDEDQGVRTETWADTETEAAGAETGDETDGERGRRRE